MEKVSWTDRVRDAVLHSQGGKEHPTKQNKGTLTGLVTS